MLTHPPPGGVILTTHVQQFSAARAQRYLLTSSPESLVLHLQTIVSRKTPIDGRLEIPESLADRLSDTPVVVSLLGNEVDARVEEMACTCAKGSTAGHRHHFLSADALKTLPPGANVNLAIDVDEGVVRIELANSR